MNLLHLAFILLALACFVLAAAGTNSRINLIAAGLFLWLSSTLLP